MTTADRIVVLGAGGHATVVLDLLALVAPAAVIGLLDVKPALWNTQILSIPVLGGDEWLRRLYQDGVRQAVIGVGSTKDLGPRRRLYELARREGFAMFPAIHPTAVVAPSVEMGDGPTIMAGAVVNACARLGANVLVNTGAIVEHECVVSDHAHVATGARLAGRVHIGVGVHVGLSACIREGIRIGDGAVVGAGAVVVADVPPSALVVGVPARVVQRLVTR